jgi:hypothetical protein
MKWHKNWRRNNYPSVMCTMAKKRAAKRGVPFKIVPGDITIPARCPVFGMKLQKCGVRGGAAAPTLDRIRPRKGYVRGNIAVISHRANRIKNDATLKELQQLVRWLKKQC